MLAISSFQKDNFFISAAISSETSSTFLFGPCRGIFNLFNKAKISHKEANFIKICSQLSNQQIDYFLAAKKSSFARSQTRSKDFQSQTTCTNNKIPNVDALHSCLPKAIPKLLTSIAVFKRN